MKDLMSNKSYKRIGIIILVILGLSACIGLIYSCTRTRTQKGSLGENLTWTLEGEVLTIEGSGAMKEEEEIVKSSGHDGSPWPKTFRKLVIKDGVTQISAWAFADSEQLEKVVIPKSVQSVGLSAFAGCAKLQEVYIDDLEMWETISFEGSSANPLSNSAALFVEGKVLTAAEYAGSTAEGWPLAGCTSLQKITVVDGVTNIPQGAFAGCTGLREIIIPKSVTDISLLAFEKCSIKKVYIEDITAWCKAWGGTTVEDSNEEPKDEPQDSNNEDFKGKDLGASDISYDAWAEAFSISMSGLSEISQEWELYLNKALVTSLVIPEEIDKIDDYTFSGCSSIQEVTIPGGKECTLVGGFSNCKNLRTVTILKEEAIDIWEEAFSNCSSLRKVVLSNCKNGLNIHAAFSGCDKLETVVFQGSEQQWKEKANVSSEGNEAFLSALSFEP